MAVFQPGRLVVSRAGRDRGSFFLVLRVDEDGFAWVVDGDKRPLERPKRKNPKHLKPFSEIAETLGQRWARGEPVKNGEVREVLRQLQERYQEEAG